MRFVVTLQAILALSIAVGFFGILWLLLKHDVDTSMRDALLIMVGALGSAFGAVVNFFFGSSSGSQVKTQLMDAKE